MVGLAFLSGDKIVSCSLSTGRRCKMKRMIDQSPLKELEDSGFIRDLYLK